ncbi:MAG: hypothetical protein IJU48_03790 [Synergistaceae bacterium]|nr:hypothetical protein [Synergistaceae bacterium]
MRLIGSIIKYFIYICIILIALGAALFWFDTGSWLVLPAAERAGNFFLDPLKLKISNINGSLRNGYTLEDLQLISGDENLLTLDYASVSPDWDLILAGKNGIPYIKTLTLKGISSDLNKTLALTNHFASLEKDEEKENSGGEEEEHENLVINPANILIERVNFGTPYANISLDKLTLDETGKLILDTKIISRDNILPLKINSLVNFSGLEVVSSDLFIGEKSTGSFSGTLEPIKARLDLTALSLDELLKFAPPIGIKASGRLDGRFFALSEDGKLKASGVVSMPRANIMDVPLNVRLPFKWDGEKILELDNAALNTQLASLKLNAETNINTLAIKADGEAKNVSLSEIGRMFAPDYGLKGENGNLRFDVDTVINDSNYMEILRQTRADLNADIPSLTAMNMNILQNLTAHVKLAPNDVPKISLGGRAFGGKLFARAETPQDEDGNIKPQAVVSIVNLDVPTLIKTFPEIAKSVKNPSGKITATAKISDKFDVNGKITSEKLSAAGVTITKLLADFDYNHEKFYADGRIKSDKLSAMGYTLANILVDANYDGKKNYAEAKIISGKFSGSGANLSNLFANVVYDGKKNYAELENFRADLGKGKITASANANLKTTAFKFAADALNIEPKIIPMAKDVMGIYNLKAQGYGNYSDLNSIRAEAVLNAKNAGYSGMTIGNVDLPVNFANSILNIQNAKASLPGGSLNLKGSVNLKNASNPNLDILASTQGLNLAEIMRHFNVQNASMPVSGRVKGNVAIKGPVQTANVNANLQASNVKAGSLVKIPNAELEANGNMQKVNIKKLSMKINSADVNGYGSMKINAKNFMNSAIDFNAGIGGLRLKPLLASLNVKAPVSGVIRASVKASGTISKPAVDVKLNRPIVYNNDIEIYDIAAKLRTLGTNHYSANVSARVGNFKPEADIDLTQKGDIWAYKVDTKPLDINSAIEAQMPSLSGIAKGFATVSVQGNTKPNSAINIMAKSKRVNVMDKIDIEKISLPVIINMAKNKVEVKNATAQVSNGLINSAFNYDISKLKWDGNMNISHLNFGKLATPFLPEGELVGSVDAKITMKGSNNVMALSFANGKFTTTPGYLHKMSIIEKVSPTKKISFEKIAGSFFWNGTDLFLNPGTGAMAGPDEPLYRYFTVNGSAGIPGNGLKLLFDGRFDVKILDQFLGAMKGVFQYMTGNILRDIFKDTAARIAGIKRRDFQNVSFTLANSWQELRLLNLKITKPIEDFLPIDILNKDEEKQRDDTQFKFGIKIPVGKGEKSVEDESAEDQLKQQLLDNLFNLDW